jgi:TRAP-type C4-dicarboxylate transport system substrate-binding protein
MKRSFPVLLLALLTGGVMAQDVTLKLHHFLAPNSPTQEGYLQPWAERVEAASNGRIRVRIFPSMQLGGSPPSLIDQVEDGVVDLAWTLPGYTAGRFPKSEVFELPFMSGRAEHSSQALCEFFDLHLRDEYRGVKVITLHTAGPGVLHLKDRPVSKLAELRGRRIRAPSRITAEALAALGAVPIGMPVPQVPEALSRGVVDGALLPWEVTAPLRVAELVAHHTEFSGPHGLYSSIFLLAMNSASYEGLPDELKSAIDENSMASGCEESRIAGASVDEADLVAERLARERGNQISLVPESEIPEWQAAVRPVIEAWLTRMDSVGFDGETMLSDARRLIAKYESESQD